MTPYWTDTNPDISIYHGDCLQVMREVLADNSIDAIVTDPPAGIGFMGKEWDHHKGGRDQWVAWMSGVMRECLRVLKPGGHSLVWAIPRTSHWTAWAIESAGFEIRDRVSHLFGSGFPKSLDVSKAIDETAGAEREVVGVREDFAARAPKNKFNQFSSINPSERGVNSPLFASKMGQITAPTTEAAKQWNGWGTALKPACEDWWLCRKPLDGTVAENVLKWGVGALNIDGCRIETAGEVIHTPQSEPSLRAGVVGVDLGISSASTEQFQQAQRESVVRANALGRWPSHVIHDGSEEVLAGFPETESGFKVGGQYAKDGMFAMSHDGEPCYNDKGNAARFFYCAKASKEDREIGLDDLPVRTAGEVTDRADGSDGLNSPRAGAGRTSGSRNVHPTVKPVELMRYLCRLITPPKGLILDPFFGSGSTGKAARKEHFRCIGIEADEYYCAIAARRCAIPQKEVFV